MVAIRGNDLLRRGIVSRLRIDMQWRQSFGWAEFHFDFTPPAIAHCISWTVSEHILVAQLNATLCGHIAQFVGIINAKATATRYIRNLAKPGGTSPLLGGTA